MKPKKYITACSLSKPLEEDTLYVLMHGQPVLSLWEYQITFTRLCISYRIIYSYTVATIELIFSLPYIVTPLIIVAVSLAGYQYYGSSTGGDDSDNEVNL